jgi:aconitate hydratase
MYDVGTYIFVPDIREAIRTGREDIPAKVIGNDRTEDIILHLTGLTESEKTILLDGCLMNYYAAGHAVLKTRLVSRHIKLNGERI